MNGTPPPPQKKEKRKKENKEYTINSCSLVYAYEHVQILPLINKMMVYFYSLYLNNINY